MTQGFRSSYMSMFAEAQGSIGVVLNGPTPLKTVEQVCKVIDIPVISTVTSKYTKIDEKLKLGVKVINISAGKPLRLFVIFASGILNCQSSLLEALQMKVF